ncbi:MAG: sigma-54 dependent transcriptional regulator [Alphaproteobacteria bacterium]|nr:sigma-54 dependent transcriptional regulator [Alphaproteobacteria bacterium]MBU2378167.1 sigma-54 dependent transcriptional regulator [Alphaproteobacteria bacterium]
MNFAEPRAVALVDDDDDFRLALAERLSLAGFEVSAFATAEAALKALDAGFAGVVVSDLRMPGLDGRQFLTRLQTIDEGLPLLMITGHGDVDDAVEALRQGAYDFVAKPFAFERLLDSLTRALEKRALVLDNRRLTLAAGEANLDLPLLGESDAMVRLRGAIVQLADTQLDVLIEGETGVGKEVVARALHNSSRRRIHSFVPVNCGALPEGLIESEIFGHEAGAFPGATRRRVGYIEQSHRGTLFLDEIESMPVPVQVKLLRVVEEREVQPIGGSPRPVEIRILASSKIDLEDAIRAGAFREDLYYRLNVVKLRVAPLRERSEDVPLLFAHFLRRAAAREGRSPPQLTAPVRRHLLEHQWPGNVRELVHFAERTAAGLDLDDDAPSADGTLGLAVRVERYEAQLIDEILRQCDGDVGQACAILQLPRKTLYDKLKRHGLKPAAYRPA